MDASFSEQQLLRLLQKRHDPAKPDTSSLEAFAKWCVAQCKAHEAAVRKELHAQHAKMREEALAQHAAMMRLATQHQQLRAVSF